MKIVSTLLFSLLALSINAQEFPQVTIPGSQVRKITSSIVKGQEYELQILLPGGYKNSGKKYPVVYVMDSQWDFPLVKSIYGQQYYDGFIPEVIIVGVTWGGTNPNPDSLRARDYTPTNEPRLKQSGGADQFLSFMKEELFPFIEKNYPAASDNRILMGCSLGGLFTLYALFTHTDLFSGYAAASPAVGWNREVLYQYEKKFAELKLSKPVRVYMTVGDVELSRPSFEKISEQMQNKHYHNVSIYSKVLENTGHSGTKSETYNRGLQYIFQKNKIELSDAVLNKYAGTYQLANGNKFELKKEGNQLFWYYSPQFKIPLYANTESHLYATHETFNIHFKLNNGVVEGFDWMRYGNTQSLKKLN